MTVRQGEVYWLDLGAAPGSGPAHRHPHVVVQNDLFNRSRISTTVVCSVTSKLGRAGAPGNVRLEVGEGGLPKASVVNVSQLYTVDKAELTDGAQTALMGVVKELQGNPTLIVELGGYTDPKGTLDYNYGLSQRRVEAVRRFLVEKGIPLTRVHAVGLGPITAKETPDEKKRRVTVKMLVDQD